MAARQYGSGQNGQWITKKTGEEEGKHYSIRNRDSNGVRLGIGRNDSKNVAEQKGLGLGHNELHSNVNSHASSDGYGHANDDGFTIVEMLYRTNMVALVSPRYASNKLVMWDDHDGICTGELLFRSSIRAIRLRSDRIAVVLEHRICVHGIADLRLIHQLDTLSNPRGLCALSPAPGSCVLACPGQKKGEVCVVLYDGKKTLFLEAHTSAIACISLCLNGSLLATASTRGTLIRLFNTADGTKIQELRRGTDQADIYSIAFSRTSHWLAVSSDKGTIHIFCLKGPSSGYGKSAVDSSSSGYINFPLSLSSSTVTGLTSSISNGFQLARSSLMSLAQSNTGSSLSFMKGVLPSYFSSEWSFAQFRLPEDMRAMVAFGKERNTVIVLCSNGSYYKCSFDELQGGEMVLEETSMLFNAPFAM